MGIDYVYSKKYKDYVSSEGVYLSEKWISNQSSDDIYVKWEHKEINTIIKAVAIINEEELDVMVEAYYATYSLTDTLSFYLDSDYDLDLEVFTANIRPTNLDIERLYVSYNQNDYIVIPSTVTYVIINQSGDKGQSSKRLDLEDIYDLKRGELLDLIEEMMKDNSILLESIDSVEVKFIFEEDKN